MHFLKFFIVCSVYIRKTTTSSPSKTLKIISKRHQSQKNLDFWQLKVNFEFDMVQNGSVMCMHFKPNLTLPHLRWMIENSICSRQPNWNKHHLASSDRRIFPQMAVDGFYGPGGDASHRSRVTSGRHFASILDEIIHFPMGFFSRERALNGSHKMPAADFLSFSMRIFPNI